MYLRMYSSSLLHYLELWLRAKRQTPFSSGRKCARDVRGALAITAAVKMRKQGSGNTLVMIAMADRFFRGENATLLFFPHEAVKNNFYHDLLKCYPRWDAGTTPRPQPARLTDLITACVEPRAQDVNFGETCCEEAATLLEPREA